MSLDKLVFGDKKFSDILEEIWYSLFPSQSSFSPGDLPNPSPGRLQTGLERRGFLPLAQYAQVSDLSCAG